MAFLIKNIVFCVTFLEIFDQTHELVELPPVEDNDILKTEAVIRDTVNKLFASLKINGIKDKPRLKQYSITHNFFVTLTLQDYNNLREIAKLTRVDKRKVSKDIANFTATLSELLNEDRGNDKTHKDNEKTEESKDENVIKYIENFISRLTDLKEMYINKDYVDINSQILDILNDEHSVSNNSQIKDDTLLLELTEKYTKADRDIEFWLPDGRRIYKGKRTKIKYFPFMASIQIFNKFQCAGSIIKSDLILTASSCLQLAYNNRFFRENPAFLSVRVGSNYYNLGGENIPILEVYFHPEYNPRNLRNNLCLLRLWRRLNFRKREKKIKKIDIDRSASLLPDTTDGITIVGWGATRFSNKLYGPFENVLSFSVLDGYPLNDCQDIYSAEYVTKKHFCAGFISRGSGACNHDVGDPGIVNGILTGVASFGSPVCGTPDAPTVFTKVGYYADWIEEIMELDVPNAASRTTRIRVRETLHTQSIPTHTTSFKILPLSNTKTTTLPINVGDEGVRSLPNDDVFKEFLATMFESKELHDHGIVTEDLQDETIAKDNPGVEKEDIEKLVLGNYSNLAVQHSTVLGDMEPNAAESTTATYFDFTNLPTVLNNEINISNDDDIVFDENITKVIDDILEEDDIKEVITNASEIANDGKAIDDPNSIKRLKSVNNIANNNNSVNEATLTLFHISDKETKGGDELENGLLFNNDDVSVEKSNEGLSIPTNISTFNDLTFRGKRNDNFYELMSKNQVYNRLREAGIFSTNRNKYAKGFLFFI